MAMLTDANFSAVEQFLLGLYRSRSVQPLMWCVLQQLPQVVGACQTTWNVVTPALGETDVMAWPAQEDHEKFQEILSRHASGHPLVINYLQTHDPSAFKISDVLSKRQFHNSALYDELYRFLGYEDQFSMSLQPPGAQWDMVVVAREKPTFQESDRMLLNMLRPHVTQAHRQARVQSRLARRLDAKRAQPAVSRVVLDAHDRIVEYPLRAQRWMEWYVHELPRTPNRLSEIVHQWLASTRTVRSGKALRRTARPLVLRRGVRQLILRLAPVNGDATTLLLEERTDPHAVARRADLPLTPRELQVLLEVEKGKHNDEIAIALGIQPRTVMKHLEHIFEKLGVDNRTAAVARLRGG